MDGLRVHTWMVLTDRIFRIKYHTIVYQNILEDIYTNKSEAFKQIGQLVSVCRECMIRYNRELINRFNVHLLFSWKRPALCVDLDQPSRGNVV